MNKDRLEWIQYRIAQTTKERVELIRHYDDLKDKHPHYLDRKALGIIRSMTIEIQRLKEEMVRK